MGLDFFGVFLQGQIHTFDSTTGDGRRYDLWLDQPDATGNAHLPPDLRALAYVSQINTEMRLGMNPKITLVLTPPFEEGLAFLDSRLVQWGVGRLSVTFGYKTGSGEGNVAGPFVGTLQKPAVQIGTDITITMNALGIGYALNLIGSGDARSFPLGYSFAKAIKKVISEVTEGHGVSIKNLYADFDEAREADPFFAEPANVAKRNVAFAGPKGAKKRDAELAKVRTSYASQIQAKEKELEDSDTTKSEQAKIQREIDVLLTEQVLKEDQVTTKYAADQEPGPIIVGPKTSWWFIHETLRNHGKELLIKGDSVKIVASEKWLLMKEGQDGGWRKHFQVRGKTDPNRNMFPILSFNSPSSFVYLNPGVGSIKMSDESDDKAKENSGTKDYNSKNTPNARTKDGEPETEETTPVATKPTDASKNIPGNPSDPQHVQRAKSEWKRMNETKGGIVAEVTSIGVPTLLPAEVVQISGFLPRGKIGTKDKDDKPMTGIFDGPYGVTKVVHTIGNGGYMTKFSAVSNFFPQAWANARKARSAKTDVQEPKPDTDKPRVSVTPKDGA